MTFIAIHGHFYQPPRENPWLETVEVQDGAHPAHDWNERITAECYAPNSAARRVGEDGRIIDIVNNYEKISFDVGPTLCAWLEAHRPEVLAAIVEADGKSARAHDGHGNAMAQVYGHAIMPLCTLRDKVTQVRWGIEDFRYRFDRDPEGMWLPETAVDRETLQVLVDAGIRFTILAPRQALAVRELGAEEWDDAGEAIDPSRAYLWQPPSGPPLAVFFYDGPISRAIAFGGALARGETLVERLRDGISPERTWPQLIHCATDGESYGHHTKFGDMALAAAIEQIERSGLATLTSHGAYLAAHPPTHEVQIREQTSWSCAHGVERWRGDCGCRFRAENHQRWRAPLRAALDWLREQVDAVYKPRAAALLKDPWEARDDYVRVVLRRTPSAIAGFLARHQRQPLDHFAQVDALRLLELQRQRLLMFTSCGWFFDDVAGIESVQLLRYAAMAIQYVRSLGGPSLEDEFLRRLSLAPSNGPLGDAAEVYRRMVRPAVVDLRRVVAHYAISGMVDEYPDEARVYAYSVRRLDEHRAATGGTALRAGRVRVRSEITGEVEEAAYAVLHHGGHDFHCGIRGFGDPEWYDRMKADLFRAYGRQGMSDIVRAMDQHFPGESYSLRHLFLDERRNVLTRVIAGVLDRDEAAYHRIWQENRQLLHYLRDVDVPAPEALGLVARHVLSREVIAELQRTEALGAVPDRAFELMGEAAALGLSLDLADAGEPMRHALSAAIDALEPALTADAVSGAVALVESLLRLGVGFGQWQTQNRLFELWRAHPGARETLRPLADLLGFRLDA